MFSTFIASLALGFSLFWGGLFSPDLQNDKSCVPFKPGQEIPEDNRWLSVCISDPVAPENGIITSVSVKYTIEHPNPNQLEIRLSKKGAKADSALWEPGNAKGAIFGKANGLQELIGAPAEGDWVLDIRNTQPGGKGHLNEVSLAVDYAPVGPIPEAAGEGSGEPVSLRIPAGAIPANTPDADPPKSDPAPVSALAQTSGWQQILNGTFEGSFPSTGWQVYDANPNDGKQYYWDDSNYKYHNGIWAAWPANGGTDCVNPDPDTTHPSDGCPTRSATYPNSMDSWMVYGPFDLSDAKSADLSFYLWRHIENNTDPNGNLYDYLFFGMSADGVNFTGYKYAGELESWQNMLYSLNSYRGDSTVYVAWYFHSDGSVRYEGPWVDDILIRKYVPGQVTVQGILSYSDRNNISQPAKDIRVTLYEIDPGGSDDELATLTLDSNGFFQFPVRLNWDDDDTDPTLENRKLDLQVRWEASRNYTSTAIHRVTNSNGQTYNWPSTTRTNVGDGTADFTLNLPQNGANLPAMWIFQDIRRAREYFLNNTNPQIDPGPVSVRWQQGQDTLLPCLGSCFYAASNPPYVFISDGSVISTDTVVHETGHAYMYNLNGRWLWWDTSCFSHDIFTQEDEHCGWSEGWADFFALAANGDQCYDKLIGPCSGGNPNSGYFNLETHNLNDANPDWHFGDGVEGRVAGALYDLMDTNNEAPYDSSTVGFGPIANMLVVDPTEASFYNFWDSFQWLAGQNNHHAIRAIYQNSIDYNFPPVLFDTTRRVLQNARWIHAIDLWDISADSESAYTDLTYQVTNVSDQRCGVVLDNHWLNITPQTGWLGSCNITVRVNDSLKSSTGIVHIDVVPVAARMYLPIILND